MKCKEIALMPSKIRRIKRIFPDIDTLIDDAEELHYQEYKISIFTHILTSEEAHILLDTVSNNIERSRTRKLQQFLIALCKKFDAYLIIYNNRKQTFEYKKIIPEKDIKLSNYLLPNHSRIKLVIPSLQAVYFEDCDFTHLFYFKNKKLLSRFKYLVKKKVYILFN
ncbi:MAG: hypothetical protein L3J43_03350 [Sulfurovum sp.]|nr:hypothetical protein [Sulfurovum sp.]